MKDWPKDSCGKLVPERLKNVFQSRIILLEAVFQLDELQGGIAALTAEPGGLDLDYKQIGIYLMAARTCIMQAAPLQPCDCTSRVDQCPMCKGLGWVSAKSLLGQRL